MFFLSHYQFHNLTVLFCHILWSHNYYFLIVYSFYFRSNSSLNLHLTNLTEESKGSYYCIATNKAGTVKKVVELSILGNILFVLELNFFMCL